MRWVLNTFHRTFLIRLSLIFEPLLRWYFSGNRFEDPIDGSQYRKFLPYGYGEQLRQNALCPGTLSLERHRLLWLYLTKETDFLNQPLKVLHLAPEQVFYRRFKQFDHWNYTTTDLNSPLAEVKADICKLPFENNMYDLIFCNHVLEHIPEDQKAMSELYRVLKKGGTLIAQVPIEEDRLKTFENWRITSQNERTKVFGQYDHVRIYGKDYYSRLEKVGFKAKAFDLISKLKPAELIYFGLKNEKIPIAVKNY
tara:strand:+ start:1261 stop:2019 length:759 start_codon:yes stop_codon:yes gene_type:complete